MTPKEAITTLVKVGYDQATIVSLLQEKGVKTTQPTISRISTGAHENPKFELGQALMTLCEEKCMCESDESKVA